MQFCEIHGKELKNGICPLCRYGIKKEEAIKLINVPSPGQYDQFGFKAAMLRRRRDKEKKRGRKERTITNNKEKFLKSNRP